jgi:Skp family chaperone for outer membrane proteins
MKNALMSAMTVPARAVTAALAFVIVLSAGAQAQQILVMSEERILRESAVGQHIATRLEAIGQEIQAELGPMTSSLRQENEALTAETSALSEEAIMQRPDLIERLQTLQRDAQIFEQTRQLRTQELAATERAAMQPVLQTLQTILQEIVQERGALILLDRSQVVFADDSISITQTAIERLNQRMTTTPVNRVRAPQQGQNGQQQ